MDKVQRGYFFQNDITRAYFEDNGYGYTAATYVEDTKQHFDYYYRRDGEDDVMTIDIKAPKKGKMSDTAFTTNFLFEYTGTSGYPGWVRGYADYIGQYFFSPKSYTWNMIRFDRDELQKFVETIPGYDKPERYNGLPPTNKWLTRNGNDSFIWIPALVVFDNLDYLRVDVTQYVLNRHLPS